MADMSFTSDIFEKNKGWLEERLQEDAHYFDKLAQGQKPEILWIGCADSRVPSATITGTSPGEIFVHRNIANLVVHTDLNLMSVLSYAVNQLQVPHIVVCGHYGCGGVSAAMGKDDLGMLNRWILNIRDVYRLHKETLDQIRNPEDQLNLLIELNVKEQVTNLAETAIIQSAWDKGQACTIHGWVYDMQSGVLKDLDCTMSDTSYLDELYKFDFKHPKEER